MRESVFAFDLGYVVWPSMLFLTLLKERPFLRQRIGKIAEVVALTSAKTESIATHR